MAAPTLTERQVHALTSACRYFPSDYAGMTGELKMANLTGREYVSAARYVRADLLAVDPFLSTSQRAQVARARGALEPAAATDPERPVTDAEKADLGRRLGTPPFPTLGRIVHAACIAFAKDQHSR